MKHLLVAAVASAALACPMVYADDEEIVMPSAAEEVETPTKVESKVESRSESTHHSKQHHKKSHAKRMHKQKRKHHKHGAHEKRHRQHHMRADDGKRQHGEQPEYETAAERKIDQEMELNNR